MKGTQLCHFLLKYSQWRMSNCISFWAIFFPDELFGYRNGNRRVISQLRAQPWLCQASAAFWRPTGGFSPTMLWRNLKIVNLQTHLLVVSFLLCSFRSQIGPQSSLLEYQSARQAIFSNLCLQAERVSYSVLPEVFHLFKDRRATQAVTVRSSVF